MAYKKKIKTLFNILLTKRREMRMMQMLNEHAHKNRREAGVMPKIINNLEENILSAARRLVAEQGYAAVTMRAIAKECGIAVGTFYNYYPSKDAMLAACLLHDWQTALASAGERTAAAQRAEEAVRAVFDAVRAFQEQNRSIFSDEGARSSAAGALQSRHAQLRAQIAALLEAPCRRFSDAPDAAFLAEFAAESILSWSGTDISFPQLWTLLKRLFIK